jgi:hypothetical protein
MPIVLLLGLSFGIRAQILCSPAELQDQCYKRLCSVNQTRSIPVTALDLAREVSAHPYQVPPQIDADLLAIGTLARSVSQSADEALRSGQLPLIVKQILSDPESGMAVIKELFGKELKCVSVDSQCELISSNLSPYGRKMRVAYQKLWDATYLFHENEESSLETKKKALIKMLRMVKHDQNEEALISGLESSKFYDYFLNAPWVETYKKKLPEILSPFKNDLEDLLKTRIAAFKKLNFNSEVGRSKIKRQCQLASYLHTRLNSSDINKRYETLRDQAISGFKKNFLPKLSSETAETLSQRLDQDTFEILESRMESHPGFPNLGFHENGYIKSSEPIDLLRDINLVSSNTAYGCRMTGLAPLDKYDRQMQKIFVSRFVVANGLGDVCSHELGHWLSQQMSKNLLSEHSSEKMSAVRGCIQNFYPKEKASDFWFMEGDKRRTEEDFADWVGAIAGTQSGLWCEMKQVIQMFEQSVQRESYTPQAHDDHSNFLFREMNIRLNRGEKLPGVCQDLMKVYPHFRPGKCELK